MRCGTSSSAGASAFEELEVSAEEFIDAGDLVPGDGISPGARPVTSGVEVDARFYGGLYPARRQGGLACDEYVERSEALEAVGLSE